MIMPMATGNDKNRAQLLIQFITDHGWGDATREAILGDCSYRMYERLHRADGTACILMDAPPPEETAPFIHVTTLLAKTGLSVPHIIAQDSHNGFLLLEDLGSHSYTKLLAQAEKEQFMSLEFQLYDQAIDALCQLQSAPVDSHLLPAYSEEKLLDELALFIDWYLVHLGCTISDSARDAFFTIWKSHLFPQLNHSSQVVVHRDYHADNLFWLEQRTGANKVGIIDYQDAVMGHPAYDVMSLIEDARRDLLPTTAERALQRYLNNFSESERIFFMQDYAILGAQRNLKITGIFARMHMRNNKPQYLDYLPRVLNHIAHDLAHPALAPLCNWLRDNTPIHLQEALQLDNENA